MDSKTSVPRLVCVPRKTKCPPCHIAGCSATKTNPQNPGQKKSIASRERARVHNSNAVCASQKSHLRFLRVRAGCGPVRCGAVPMLRTGSILCVSILACVLGGGRRGCLLVRESIVRLSTRSHVLCAAPANHRHCGYRYYGNYCQQQ